MKLNKLKKHKKEVLILGSVLIVLILGLGFLVTNENYNFEEQSLGFVGTSGPLEEGNEEDTTVTKTLDTSYSISDDKVYSDKNEAFMSATPHTKKGSGYVNYEIETEEFTGELYVMLGFPQEADSKPLWFEEYDPHNVTRTYDVTETFNNTNLRDLEDIETEKVSCDVGEGRIVKDFKGTIVCYDEVIEDESNNTLTFVWEQQEIYVKDFKRLDYRADFKTAFNDKNDWYLTKIDVEAGIKKDLQVWLEVKENTKYDLVAYPSSYGTDTLGQNLTHLI